MVVSSSGPPLTTRRCESLQWKEQKLSESDTDSLLKPLKSLRGMRDGAVLILRSRAAYEKYSQQVPGDEIPRNGAPVEKGKGKHKTKTKASPGSLSTQIADAASRMGSFKNAVCKAPSRPEKGLVIRVQHSSDEKHEQDG